MLVFASVDAKSQFTQKVHRNFGQMRTLFGQEPLENPEINQNPSQLIECDKFANTCEIELSDDEDFGNDDKNILIVCFQGFGTQFVFISG